MSIRKSENVIAINISPDKESMDKLKARWSELDTDILLMCCIDFK